MYKSAIAGLFLCAFVFVAADSSTASAEALDLDKISVSQQPLTEVLEASIDAETASTESVAEQPKIVSHTVETGDSLTTIAGKYQTTWKRLFDKNIGIQDPNVITTGQNIVIPAPDETITERAVPVETPEPATVTASARVKSPSATTTTSSYSSARGTSAGNRYTAGYCTWYVKNMRPDLPNNLGNANTWVSRAAAQGMATGSSPRAGAVGQRGMHVVYVESVNPDGSVTISEMNHKGLYVRTVRTLPASYFTYIY